MSLGPTVGRPLLPDHPPLLHRDKHGEHTVWVSPDCPRAMERSNGCWCLSDFALHKQLYKGKASTLYHATDKASGVAVALKWYSKRRLSDLNWYQVEREILLHSQLCHPNIIQLYAAFEDDNYVFLVTEFAAGGDLYEDLKRAGGQHRERVVAGDILPPFMSALAHMHARSVVHRDIKPENILLAADRTVKVADFGLSINWGEERPVTRAGTLDYMSPEVLLCPEKSRPDENKEKVELGYTDAVDVWAAGILVYELLVGRPPFECETREETYNCIAKREPAMPSWMSEGAKQFIGAALAKSARKRPSMGELLRHPWILQHARRPSTPAPSPLHLPLHELAGEGAYPFGQLHRASLHGAKSCRDFGTLLHTHSFGPAGCAAVLSSAGTATASSLAAAAAADAAVDGVAAGAAASSSSLGLGGSLGSRPAMPWAALLPTVPITSAAPAFAARSPPTDPSVPAQVQTPAACAAATAQPPQADGSGLEAGSQQYGQHGQQSAQPARATSGHCRTAAAAPAEGSFFSTASFVSTSSTSVGIETSGHSFTHSMAALRAPSSSMGLPKGTAAAAPASETPGEFLELYKSMAPAPALPERTSCHSPRGGQLPHKGSSSSLSLDASFLPPLAGAVQKHPGQESAEQPPFSATARLPSPRKAISSPVLQDLSEGITPGGGPALPAAVPLSEEPPVAALDPILEQRSSEAEPASQPQSAPRLVEAAFKIQQTDMEAESDAGQAAIDGLIPADCAGSGACGHSSPVHLAEAAAAASQQAQHGAGEGIQAADMAASGGNTNPGQPTTGQAVALHRDRTASLPSNPASSKLGVPAGTGKGKGKQSQGSSSIGSGIAKSASSLINKLLRRKPAAGTATAVGATTSADKPVAASRPEAPASGPAATAAAVMASPPSGKQKARLSPPLVQIRAYTTSSCGRDYSHVHSSGYGQQASLRSKGSPMSSSPRTSGLVRRVPSNKAAGTSSSPWTAAAPPALLTLRSSSLSRSAISSQVTRASSAAPEPSAAPPSLAGCTLPSTIQEAAAEPLLRCASTKGVRFADAPPAGLVTAEPSGNMEDLILAIHGPEASETLSYTSANSSLPASRLPSLTAGSGAATPSVSRKSSAASMSPPVSRKGSLAASASGGRVSLTRLPSLRSMGASRTKPRTTRMASLPGDGKAGGAGGPGIGLAKPGADDHEEAVQQSAASWSHPAVATRAGRTAADHKLSASATRLSVYKQLVAGPASRSTKHCLHKPAAVAGGHSALPAGKTKP